MTRVATVAAARAGTTAVSAAAVLWAAGASVGRRLFDRGASPLELTAARAWVAALVIGAIVLVRRTGRGRGFSALIIPFGLSIALANYTYYFAISRLPVAIAIVIQYTAPGFVVLWVAVATRTAPSRRVVAALLAALAGVALLAELPQVLARGELGLDALGVLAAIGSAIGFGVYVVVGEPMGARYGTDGALARGFTVAGLFWLLVLIPGGRPDTLLDPSYTGGLAFVAVFATVVPFPLFVWGLGWIGPARAAIVSTLEPVAATVFALLFLDQRLSIQQLVGGVLVIAGITVVQTERPQSPTVAAEAAAVE